MTTTTSTPLRTRKHLAQTAAIAGLLMLAACATKPTPLNRAEAFPFPDVLLVNQEGQKVGFKDQVTGPEPLVVTFIYTTCTTVCPVTSTGFASLQGRLGDDTSRVRLVAVSVDPEHDTPRVMKNYLQTFRAKPGWNFLTGSREDIQHIRREFDLRVPGPGPSMPISYLRSPKDGKWIRLSGTMPPGEFVAACLKEGFP